MAITNPVALRHPFTLHFAAAMAELGYPADADFNGPEPEGAGFYRITTRNGRRWSSADAFLRPAVAARCVRLITSAPVNRVILKAGRAVGVSYVRHGSETIALARRAVVMAAGAIQTPQILQVSGIGDGGHLSRIGIPVRLHNPNVGQHLQDHLAVGYYFRTRKPTLNGQLHSLTGKVKQALLYAATRGGPLANSVNQYGGFLRSSDDLQFPDQQLYLNPATYSIARRKNGLVIQPDPFNGYTLSFQPTRPKSRGWVKISSADISDGPAISLGALTAETDLHGVVAGARLVGRLAASKTLQKITEAPLSNCPTQMTDHEIIDDFRARAGSVFHPCGSCAMGADAATAVVGPNLAVHGIDGLFIADASVFPSIPSGNINAPTLMVAHKGATHILESTSGGPAWS
jgi:choline dehydrogenase